MKMRFNFFKDLLSLIFPTTCCICGKSLFDFENQLCKPCVAKLPLTNYHLFPYQNDLTEKLIGDNSPHQVISFLRFSKKGISQKLLHQLKYKNKPELGRELGRIYAHLLLKNNFKGMWNCLVPVPLHPIKKNRRGYNQSEEFALGIGEVLEIPVKNALIRSKFTETQTKMSKLERVKNVSDVFIFDPKYLDLHSQNVLIVDDVMTTGATLAACAQVLLNNGVGQIDMAVIAAGK
jgi:ComF family protein